MIKFDSGLYNVRWNGEMKKAQGEILAVLVKNGLNYLEILVILESLPPYLTSEALNMALAGTSGSGKSKLQKVILCQLIENYTPEELEIYYLDNQGGIEAGTFRNVKHVKESD